MFHFFFSNSHSLQDFLYLLAIYLPRVLMFLYFFPLFNKGLGNAGFTKVAVAAVLLLEPVSMVLSGTKISQMTPVALLLNALTEVMLGMMLGLTMAVPYYFFKAYGALVDVYRGATFAAQAGGMSDTSAEELPLESLFGLLFAAVVFAGPGLEQICKLILQSYLAVPPGAASVSQVGPWGTTLMRLLADHVTLAFILSAPLLIVILIVEVSVEIISAFTPQLQVYSLQYGFRSIAAIGALLVFLNFAEPEVMRMLVQQANQIASLIQGVK